MYIVFDAELAGISKSSSSVKRNGIYSPYEFVKIMEEEKGNIIRTANVNMPRVNLEEENKLKLVCDIKELVMWSGAHGPYFSYEEAVEEAKGYFIWQETAFEENPFMAIANALEPYIQEIEANGSNPLLAFKIPN